MDVVFERWVEELYLSASRHVKAIPVSVAIPVRRFLSASVLGVAQRKSGENQEMLNRLGGRIRELREEFGISQAELCRRLQRAGWDCDTLVMSRIERGVRTLTDIEILAIVRVLNKSLKDF